MARKYPNRPTGGGMNMASLKKMQEDMMATQQELEQSEYSATSGGGMVTATVSGKHELLSLLIDPKAVDPEDVEMLQDMICAAVNSAMTEADSTAEKEMAKLTGGLNIPGLM